METENFGPKHVYVAFFDILGFSQAVSNNDPSVIKGLYGTMEMVAEDNQSAMKQNMDGILRNFRNAGLGNEDFIRDFEEVYIDALSVSDSIFLWTSNDSALSFHHLVHHVCRLLAQFMLMGYPARAAISSGNVAAQNVRIGLGSQRNVYGDGLAKAHSLEGIQEWSGAIIDEQTLFEVEAFKRFGEIFLNALYRENYIVSYEAPLKKGKVGTWPTINWAKHLTKNDLGKGGVEIKAKFAAYNKPIDDWAVRTKIDNTVRFYQEMKKPVKKGVTS